MNNSILLTIKRGFLTLASLLLAVSVQVQTMEQKAEPTQVQLYNLAQKDIAIGAYSPNKDVYSRANLDTIYTKPGQTKDEITATPIDMGKKWFVTITDKAEQTLPKNTLPAATANVLDINKFIDQQLTEKPWLKNRTLFVFIKDAPSSYYGTASRMLGYQTQDLMIAIADQNPETNTEIKTQKTEYRIKNPSVTELIMAHYFYDKDAQVYRFKEKKKIGANVEKKVDYTAGDKIYVTSSQNTAFPQFELPKTNVIELVDKVNEKLKTRPELDGAELLITIENVGNNEISITKNDLSDYYLIGSKDSNVYDITTMRINTEKGIIANQTINRILLYAKGNFANKTTDIRKNIIRNVLILIPNEPQSNEFWKLETPTMKNILASVKEQNFPTEIVSFTWTSKDSIDAVADNLAKIVNENYNNSNTFTKISVIAHEKGGVIARKATHKLQRPIDSIYQIFTPHHETTLHPINPSKCKTLFNFYIETGNEFFNTAAPARIINLATTYLTEQVTPANIAPLLARLDSIAKIIADNYKLNNNLALAIEPTKTQNDVFITIKKDVLFADEKETQNQQEKQFSLEQLKALNQAYPKSAIALAIEYGKKGGEYVASVLPSTETIKAGGEYITSMLPSGETIKTQTGALAQWIGSYLQRPAQVEQPKKEQPVQQTPAEQKKAEVVEKQPEMQQQKIEEKPVIKEGKQEEIAPQQQPEIKQPETQQQPKEQAIKESKQEQIAPQPISLSKEEVTKEEGEELLSELQEESKPVSKEEVEQQLEQLEKEITLEEKPSESQSKIKDLTKNIKRAENKIAELRNEIENIKKEIKEGKLVEKAIERRKQNIATKLTQIKTFEQQKLNSALQINTLKKQLQK